MMHKVTQSLKISEFRVGHEERRIQGSDISSCSINDSHSEAHGTYKRENSISSRLVYNIATKEKKKLPKVQGKMLASCTVLEDPRDVLRYVPKSSMTQLKLTPAHQSFEGPRTNPTPVHIGGSLGTLAIRPPDDLRKKKEDEALFHQQH